MQKERWDLVVVGAGPAGMTAAQYGSRANLRTLLIEEMAPGGLVLLIHNMENYPGFPEGINGFDYSEAMRKQTENFGTTFLTASVTSIKKEANYFQIKTSDEVIESWTVVIATGSKHKHLGIPGEEELSGRGVSYCGTCDGPFFRGKKILVVGGGDAACDEGAYLSHLTDQVVMIHRRDKFRAQKALGERIIKNKKIDLRFNHILKEIKGDEKVQKVVLWHTETGKSYEEEMDAVFIFIGAIPQTGLVPYLKKDDGGYLVTNQRMETSVPGLYVVGDVRSTPFRQVVVAAGEGAISAHIASQHIDDMKGESYD